jgi:hypothetical protein
LEEENRVKQTQESGRDVRYRLPKWPLKCIIL